MITPKTNWTATDYFNIDDYTRITSNLNELAGMVGVAKVAFRTVTTSSWWAVSDIMAICSLYFSIANAIGWSLSPPASQPFFFDWEDLNLIEGLVADYIGLGTEASHCQGNTYGDGLYYGGGIVE